MTSPQPQPSQVNRKVRCRVDSRITRDPCANEVLDEFGVCLHHLESVAAHWAGIVGELIGQIDPDEGEKLRTIVDTLRRYSGETP